MESTINAGNRPAGAAFDAALVSMFDKHHLYALARERTPESRSTLADAVANFFDFDLKDQESELAADVLMSLLQQAELDLRQALAERLSANERVPLRIALSLANDDISVARHVLQHSPVLNEFDLAYIVQAQSKEHWAAIAARRDLSPLLVGTLAQKRDIDIARTLLGNEHVTLEKDALEIFIEMAKTSDELHLPLVHRAELPSDLVQTLYWTVGEALRKHITERFKDHNIAEAVDTTLNDIQADLSQTLQPQAKPVSTPSYSARDLATPVKMIEALRLGQFSYFMALFSQYSGLQNCMVDTLIKQRGGKGLAIACKALQMERSDFMTLFMLKSSLANRDKIVDHTEMANALSVFDRTEKDFAVKMLHKAIATQQNLALA